MVQEDGSYSGFDDQEFTSRSGGKCKAIMHIKVGPASTFNVHYHFNTAIAFVLFSGVANGIVKRVTEVFDETYLYFTSMIKVVLQSLG